MNFLPCITTGLLMIGLVKTSSAQSPSPDNTSAQPTIAPEAAGVAAPSPSPIVPVEPPSLIPPNILPGPAAGSLPQMPGGVDLQQLNALFKQTSLGKTADKARLHQQMAQLETRIRNDDDLHGARATADGMKTDLEKRHQLRAYYHLYYNKLRPLALTPELKAYLDLQEKAHLALLLQPKTRHESDEAEAHALAVTLAGAGAHALPTPAQAKVEQAPVRP